MKVLEGEVVGAGVIGFQHHRRALRSLGGEHGHSALRNLEKHVQLLARGRGIGHHHLTAIDDAGEEFAAHKLVRLLAGLLDVAVTLTIEVLTDEEFRAFLVHFCRTDLLMEKNAASAGCEGDRVVFLFHLASDQKYQSFRKQSQPGS